MRSYIIRLHTPLWIHHSPPFPHSRHSKDINLLMSPAEQLILSQGLHMAYLARKVLAPGLRMMASLQSGLCSEIFAESSLGTITYHFPSLC